jgi:hypothetical protein
MASNASAKGGNCRTVFNPVTGDITQVCDCDPDCDENPGDENIEIEDDLTGGGSGLGRCLALQEETSISELEDAACRLYCHNDYIEYVFRLIGDIDSGAEGQGVWVITHTHIVGENDFTFLDDGTPVCMYDQRARQPCETITITPDGKVFCTGSFGVTASAQVPCVNVLRDPYPRGMVSMPVNFWAQGPWSAVGTASSQEWCSPDIRNFTLQVAWQARPDISPAWEFNDRDWSDEPAFASGTAVTHTFQTSSWGLPENGPSLEGQLELPAYQVRLYTAWQPFVQRWWDERREVFKYFCPGNSWDYDDESILEEDQCCFAYLRRRDGEDVSIPGICYEDTWVRVTGGMVPIDLREFGYPNDYWLSPMAGDVSVPPVGVPMVPYDERLCNIPVPVIEVQSLLLSPGSYLP